MPATATDRLQGLSTSVAVKPPCRAVATTALTLSGEQTVSGVACVTGDRVLQAIAAGSVNNGIWIVSTGAWTRAKDFDGSRDAVKGTIILVAAGTPNAEFYVVTTSGTISPGTTSFAIEPAGVESATLLIDIANAANAAKGAGLSGVDLTQTALAYAASTVGWALRMVSAQGANVLRWITPSDWTALFNKTSTVDCTAAFNSAKSASDHVIVPYGRYPITTMLEFEANKGLYLSHGSEICRLSSMSAATTPLIWFKGSFSGIKGHGGASRIFSQNRAPDGVILIGHRDMTQSHADVLGCFVESVRVTGALDYGQTSGNPDACIKVINPQIGGLASYFHTISNVWLESSNNGLWLQGWANGMRIRDIHVQWMGNTSVLSAAVYCQGGLDNSFVGMFHHFSANTPSLRIRDYDNTATPGGSLHVAAYSTYASLICEQGGASAYAVVANATCTGFKNTLQVVDNVALGNDISTTFKNINNLLFMSDSGTSYEFMEVRKTMRMNGLTIHNGTPQTLTGAGAVDITSSITHIVTTGANALTLADGAEGQWKYIVMKTDGGDGTLTPANFAGTLTTITFNDVGDSANLLFTNGQWHFMGGTATAA